MIAKLAWIFYAAPPFVLDYSASPLHAVRDKATGDYQALTQVSAEKRPVFGI
jgi:hypothetical protein